jgi:hypothetical protein
MDARTMLDNVFRDALGGLHTYASDKDIAKAAVCAELAKALAIVTMGDAITEMLEALVERRS